MVEINKNTFIKIYEYLFFLGFILKLKSRKIIKYVNL